MKNADPVEEILYGVAFNGDAIELIVMTTGYTSADDFELRLDKGFTGHPPYLLTVYRIRPDHGKMMPRPLTLTFSRQALGAERDAAITVTNELRTLPRPSPKE